MRRPRCQRGRPWAHPAAFPTTNPRQAHGVWGQPGHPHREAAAAQKFLPPFPQPVPGVLHPLVFVFLTEIEFTDHPSPHLKCMLCSRFSFVHKTVPPSALPPEHVHRPEQKPWPFAAPTSPLP